MSLQAQLGRLHTTHWVTFLHWCVHSMAPNLNSEPSQLPSSFTVALHGSSKLPRLILQHCLRESQATESQEDFLTVFFAELAALPLIIISLACSP